MASLLTKRYVATACTKFTPLVESYKTLRHIHFPGITSFEQGQAIQNTVVQANLDFKKMESKIRKQQREMAGKGLVINEYEDELLSKILAMKPMPTVLTFEFENVYTGGKKMKQDPLMHERIHQFEALGCKYHQLERGGQVTWHGAGQLVAYVVMDLKLVRNLSVKCFVDSVLLRAVENLLAKNYALDTFSSENPGVWLARDDLKVASVGCNIQRGITSYGVGLNVRPDLKYLNTFEMCGLQRRATSIEEQLRIREKVSEKVSEKNSGVSTSDKIDSLSVKETGDQFAKELARLLNITTVEHMNGEELKKSVREQNVEEENIREQNV